MKVPPYNDDRLTPLMEVFDAVWNRIPGLKLDTDPNRLQFYATDLLRSGLWSREKLAAVLAVEPRTIDAWVAHRTRGTYDETENAGALTLTADPERQAAYARLEALPADLREKITFR